MKNLIYQQEKNRIDAICQQFKINNYKINNDSTLDVSGSVSIRMFDIQELPLEFNTVSENFECDKNKLTTLKGCPRHVGKIFDCGYNYLTSLVGGPDTVGSHYTCEQNELISLEGCAETIGGYLDCFNNPNLRTTYSGNTDISLGTHLEIGNTQLLNILDGMHSDNFKVFLKYQRFYDIWNDDLSLNQNNLENLMNDIKDGLE